MSMINAHENDKRYLISASWWREWCDYTNFDLSQLNIKNGSQILQSSFIKNKSAISNIGGFNNDSMSNTKINQMSL